jgi:hypothetical protein
MCVDAQGSARVVQEQRIVGLQVSWDQLAVICKFTRKSFTRRALMR